MAGGDSAPAFIRAISSETYTFSPSSRGMLPKPYVAGDCQEETVCRPNVACAGYVPGPGVEHLLAEGKRLDVPNCVAGAVRERASGCVPTEDCTLYTGPGVVGFPVTLACSREMNAFDICDLVLLPKEKEGAVRLIERGCSPIMLRVALLEGREGRDDALRLALPLVLGRDAMNAAKSFRGAADVRGG